MRSTSAWTKLFLAIGALVLAAAVLAYQTMTFAANEDVLKASLAGLAHDDRARAEALIQAETKALTRNEESGVVYYHSTRITGKANRVYALWLALSPESAQCKSLRSEARLDDTQSWLGVCAYVDLGFHSFRTKYDMTLAELFEDRSLGILHGTCYAWDEKTAAWSRIGPVENEALLALLTDEQKRDIRRGVYNKVCVVEAN